MFEKKKKNQGSYNNSEQVEINILLFLANQTSLVLFLTKRPFVRIQAK